MGRFSGVLLVSDFDNTLVYTHEILQKGGEIPPLSEKNRCALEYFKAEGGLFAVATGRALPSFIHFAPMVPMNAPGVICNGAVLYDFSTGEVLESALLDEVVRAQVQTVLDCFPEVAVEAYHIDNVIHTVHPNEITRRHAHMSMVDVTETASMLDVPMPLGKLLFEAERNTLEKVHSYIVEQGWTEKNELVFSGEVLLEMTVKGANKGAMVRRLAERLGISMEHVYCVGDECNDITMLNAAKTGFAPANCAPAVRESGATIVSDVRQDALADVIDILTQRYK